MRRLVLVRHGEVHAQWSGRCYGFTDVALSDRGRDQSRRLAARLAAEGVAAIHTSDLSRARFLARELERLTGQTALVDRDLRERNFGDWETRSWEEIHAVSPGEMDRMVSDPAGWRPPGGETTFDLRDRVVAWFERLRKDRRGDSPGNVVAVTHGGPIGALRGSLQRQPVPAWLDQIPPCGSFVSVPIEEAELEAIAVEAESKADRGASGIER